MATLYGFEPIPDLRLTLGESPVYDESRDCFWCVDIDGQKLIQLQLPDLAVRTRDFDEKVCAVGLCMSGRLILALHDSIILFEPENGNGAKLADIEPDNPRTRCNDSKTGPDGAFYVGTMDLEKPRTAIGGLYRLGPDLQVTQLLSGLTVSNGLAWSADGKRMFHADTGPMQVTEYPFDDETGSIGDGALLIQLDEEHGKPDGAALDANGHYWSAGVSSGCLNRIRPTGELAEVVRLPVANPTMLAFGGPDFRNVLVTSLDGNGNAQLLLGQSKVAGIPDDLFDDSAFG